jgi:hypothetical protein
LGEVRFSGGRFNYVKTKNGFQEQAVKNLEKKWTNSISEDYGLYILFAVCYQLWRLCNMKSVFLLGEVEETWKTAGDLFRFMIPVYA